MKIELIPVIELRYKVDKNIPTPKKPHLENISKWEQYYNEQLKLNGYQNYVRTLKGYNFYRVNQFESKSDLIKIIECHLGGKNGQYATPLAESCALFGGCILKVDHEIVFVPQCCGDLSDFTSWKKISKNGFREGSICLEGHPCPYVKRDGAFLKFSFNDKWEDFLPPAIDSILNREKLLKAVLICEAEIDQFRIKLDNLKDIFGDLPISNILLYPKEKNDG